MVNDNIIRVRPYPCCYLCGKQGQPVYHGLQDRLFNAPGEWNINKCPDSECGLMWLDPMPLAEDIGKAYQSYYTHRETGCPSVTWPRRIYQWAREGYLAKKYGYNNGSVNNWKKMLGQLFYFHPGRRANLDFSVMYLSSVPNGLLLDVGCGSGQKLMFMEKQGWLAEGLDIDPVSVDQARAKGLQVRSGSLEAQSYPDNYFDAVTMSHLIEHVYDPLAVFQECHRILKPGGRLVVVTPNNESWGHKIYKTSWLALDPPRHLHIFSLMSLNSLTKKAGFQKFKSSTTIREANGLFVASRAIHSTGKYLWGSSITYPVRIWARGMQLAEWAILKLKPGLGEDIVMVGEK